MIALFIILGLVAILIACGVSLNMYLYTKGALRTVRLRRARGTRTASVKQESREPTTIERFYISLAHTQPMTHFVRRSILLLLGGVVLLAAVLMSFFYAVLH